MDRRFVCLLVTQFAIVLSQSNKALKLGVKNPEPDVFQSISSAPRSAIDDDPFFENSQDLG